MYSLNTSTKKARNRSTIYIVGAGIAVLAAVAGIWLRNMSDARKSTLEQLEARVDEDRQVLRNDMVLHDHFRKLQDLDQEFATLLTGGFSTQDLQRAQAAIDNEEKGLKTTIDSISTASTRYKVWANVVLSDSISAAFRKALANRQYLSNLRVALQGRQGELKGSDKELLQMQIDMQKKDERIAALEIQLKARNSTVANAALPEPSANKSQLEKRVAELESGLKDEELRNAGLLDVTRNLKADNEKLTAELSRVRRGNAADDASTQAAKSKLSALQEQVDDLNAELNFAAIDCSLTRADANKIISNSRQRRELLAQALKSLQDLSRSDNAAVQRKAREKLGQLNQIASTVRD